MSFVHPHLLWLLLLPAALVVADRARRLAAEAQSWPTIRRLWAGPRGLAAGDRGVRLPRRYSLWLGLALLIVALARPQWGRIEERVFDQSREVLLALDLSRSMLATDVKPSRLGRSRLLVESLLDRLKGERVGLLVFSGTAFLQCPLSPDYEVLREFLPSLTPDYLPEGGTDYGKLLKAALEAFSNEAGADRYLIILSDGEALTEEWRSQLETLKQRGIRVIALGVGTEGGSIIPAKDGGFVKDERGAVVMSKLNPTTLKQLASATGGAYADASGWVDLPALLDQTVERGKQGALSERRTVRLGERFQWFLAPALLLLLFSYWREFPVTPKARDLRRHLGGAAVLLAFALLSLPPAALAANLTPAPSGSPQIAQPAQPPPSELPKLVEQLAAQPSLSAADCAKLAQETLTHGRNTRQAGQQIQPGIVQDGLAAVGQGERLDPKAADWPTLRSQLEELLRPPEQQDQQKDDQKQDEKKQDQQQQQQDQNQQQNQDQKNQDQEQKDQQQQQQQQQDQQKSEEQKQQEQKQQEQQQAEQQRQQDEKQQQQQQAQQAQQEPPKDDKTQKIGGAKDQDTEAKEHPELAVPLQKLDQVRDQDSPAELFNLLNNSEPRANDQPKKDW